MAQKRANQPTSFSLSELGRSILRRIAEYHGIPQSNVIEIILREKAREIGPNLPEDRGPVRRGKGGSA